MSSRPDRTINLLKPYIRLTKSSEGKYSIWIAVFAPKSYEISDQPNVTVKNPKSVQVDVKIDGPKRKPAGDWGVFPLKVSLPTPNGNVSSGAEIKVTIWLDDPEDEGSSVIQYDEAEDE